MKTKKEKQTSLLKTVVLSGMIAGALPLAANANDLFSYSDMGSGAEVRSSLLDKYGSPLNAYQNQATDFIIGEAKCGEGKCGEGKCGEGEKKAEAKKGEAKKAETKTTEAKCGEGKCGESEKKAEAKKGKAKKGEAKKAETKTTEGKCGEGKCGS
ncbi:MAG: hypothetical protein JEZ14_11855 [Marinilabiliaceae bacterium]|nr:hypothetical protein [Marinilabiliaceae bacterium]